jgi:hypothetical protein
MLCVSIRKLPFRRMVGMAIHVFRAGNTDVFAFTLDR